MCTIFLLFEKKRTKIKTPLISVPTHQHISYYSYHYTHNTFFYIYIYSTLCLYIYIYTLKMLVCISYILYTHTHTLYILFTTLIFNFWKKEKLVERRISWFLASLKVAANCEMSVVWIARHNGSFLSCGTPYLLNELVT